MTFGRGAMLAVAGALAAGAALAAPGYHLQSAVKLPGAAPAWDYIALDPNRPRLFLGRRKDGEQVYDLRRKAMVKRIARSEGANAARLAPHFDRGYTANEDGTTTIFRLSSLATLARVKLGGAVDSVFYEPITSQMVFTLGDDHELVFLDARSGRPTGRTHIGAGELEAVVADGRGFVFVNERDRNQIAKIDARSHRLAAEWPLPGCAEPTGLAMDVRARRLFVGCRGERPILAVVDADSGKMLATQAIGRGNDGVVFDPARRLIFTSNGVDSNIVVIAEAGADAYRFAGAFTTRPNARTMALDPASSKIYTVTAEGVVDPAKPINTGPSPFYPNRYLDNTFTVLTYAPD